MPFSGSPYVDGNTTPQQRAIFITSGLHYTGIYPHDDFIENGRLKTMNQKFIRRTDTGSATATLGESFRWDLTKVRMVFMRIDNTNATLNEFIIDICAHWEDTGGFWEEYANGDYFFTNGTGEKEGNASKIIRAVSPANPRTLAATGSTWLALNTEYIGGIRVRAKTASGTATMTARSNQTLL